MSDPAASDPAAHVPDRHAANKAVIATIRRAMYDFDGETVRRVLATTFEPEATVRLAFPFEDLPGGAGWFDEALRLLFEAVPDLERRDTIVMGGPDGHGNDWVGCCGYYTGTFLGPFLGIPPSGRHMTMRFHEFFRVADGRIHEMQAMWDIPEVMMQSGVWPMGPSLGREWHVPGPARADGILTAAHDEQRSEESKAHVLGMLADMGRHPSEPVEAMRLDHWWHPRFSWYGPSGIGTSRGAEGFRNVHQIPFLKAMPDRTGGGYEGETTYFFGDGDFVGETGWPGMNMTVSGDGWLGIAPTQQRITMRSLDFWRVERSADDPNRMQIRENWVLVDLLHAWNQLGVDVLERARELARLGLRSTS